MVCHLSLAKFIYFFHFHTQERENGMSEWKQNVAILFVEENKFLFNLILNDKLFWANNAVAKLDAAIYFFVEAICRLKKKKFLNWYRKIQQPCQASLVLSITPISTLQ
jgi:hypothetical protein